MATTPKRLNLLFVSLLLGGSIALLGYQSLKDKEQIDLQQISVVSNKVKKSHLQTSDELVFTLHGKYNIESVVKNPDLIRQRHLHNDELNQEDRNAMQKLIDKITTK